MWMSPKKRSRWRTRLDYGGLGPAELVLDHAALAEAVGGRFAGVSQLKNEYNLMNTLVTIK